MPYDQNDEYMDELFFNETFSERYSRINLNKTIFFLLLILGVIEAAISIYTRFTFGVCLSVVVVSYSLIALLKTRNFKEELKDSIINNYDNTTTSSELWLLAPSTESFKIPLQIFLWTLGLIFVTILFVQGMMSIYTPSLKNPKICKKNCENIMLSPVEPISSQIWSVDYNLPSNHKTINNDKIDANNLPLIMLQDSTRIQYTDLKSYIHNTRISLKGKEYETKLYPYSAYTSLNDSVQKIIIRFLDNGCSLIESDINISSSHPSASVLFACTHPPVGFIEDIYLHMYCDQRNFLIIEARSSSRISGTVILSKIRNVWYDIAGILVQQSPKQCDSP